MGFLNTNPNCMLGFWCYYEKRKSVIRNHLSVVDTSRSQVGQFCPPQLQSSFHHHWLRPHIRTQAKKTECSPTGMVLRTLLFSDLQRSTSLVPLSGILVSIHQKRFRLEGTELKGSWLNHSFAAEIYQMMFRAIVIHLNISTVASEYCSNSSQLDSCMFVGNSAYTSTAMMT